jgi:hypothetical protein
MMNGENPLISGMAFRSTSPFNPAFDSMGTTDMNFFHNTGPMTFYFVISLALTAVYQIMAIITRFFYKIRICRLIGMSVTSAPGFGYVVFKFFFEAYMEMLIGAILGTMAIVSTIDSAGIAGWFSRIDDIICSVVTILFLLFLVLIPPLIICLMNDRRNLRNKKHDEVFGSAW